MANELSAVTSMSQRPILLDDMLRPLWKWMRYSGIHHGCYSPVEERRVFFILRCISTVFIFLLLLNFGVFQLVQVVIGLTKESEKITNVYQNVSTLIVTMIPFQFMVHSYVQQKQFVQFFKDWNIVEIQFSHCCNRERTKKVAKAIYLSCFVGISLVLPLTLYTNLKNPDESAFFSHYEILQEKFGVYFLSLFYTISMYFISVPFLVGEFTVALFFYQAGCMIENLKLQLQNCSMSLSNQHTIYYLIESPYRLIWERFESILHLVNRANKLFGAVMIVSQFFYVCFTCVIIYELIVRYKECTFCYLLVFDLTLSISKFIGCSWMISHLYLSFGELKSAVAHLLSKKWHLLSHEHRNLLSSFLIRLEKEDLAARPLNMYTVDSTNLLSLLTLHISYVIVLLE